MTTITEIKAAGGIRCPSCGAAVAATPEQMAAELGRISTPRKAAAARENARKGGWPKGRKRGPRKVKDVR